VDPNGLRYAAPHYDSIVHTPFIRFNDRANLTNEEVLNLAIKESANSATGTTKRVCVEMDLQ